MARTSLVSDYLSAEAHLNSILNSDPYDNRIDSLREQLEDLWFSMNEEEHELVSINEADERVRTRSS